MKRINLKKAGGYAAAVAGAFDVANLICAGYYFMPGWLERAGGATSAIWRPGGLISQMAEGHGIQTVDRNGYVNPDIPLEEEGYILVL